MTERLYYNDGYLRSIEAVVQDAKDGAIKLDRTIFYPEAGGQPGDRGMFGDLKIVDTQKDEDGDVLHILEKGSRVPEIGEKAVLALDWEHRYFYMREHTAQHLVSALLFSLFSIGTVAVHQGEEGFTIETDKSEIDEDALLAVESAAIERIGRNLRVWQDEVNHEEAESLHMRRSIKVSGRVKLVHIEDTDVVACGGVHLASTGEIEELCYVFSERIRGHVRTFWKCGESARKYRRENARIISSLTSLFSAEPANIVHEAEKTLSEYRAIKHNLAQLSEKLALNELKCALDETNSSKIVIFGTDVGVSYFDSAIDKDHDGIILVADSEGKFLFHGDSNSFEKLRSGIEGIRGGGRGLRYRGSYQGKLKAFLDDARDIYGKAEADR